MHANGYFQYGAESPTGMLEFEGRFWNQNEFAGATVDETGALRVSSNGNDGFAWTGIDVQAGQRYALNAVGFQDIDSSEVPNAFLGEFSLVGVDFFDEQGVEIGEELGGLRPLRRAVNLDFVVPEGTQFATIWVAVAEFPGLPSSTAVIESLSLTNLQAGDTTPPVAHVPRRRANVYRAPKRIRASGDLHR